MRQYRAVLGLSLLSVVSATVFERAQCNADNCLRALRNPNDFQPKFDCDFGQQFTVTPCPTPTTLTFVQESGGRKPYTAKISQPASTTICPQTQSTIYLPYYATKACDEARFTSACSCIGAPSAPYILVPDAVVATTTTTVKPSPTNCNTDFILVPLNRNVSNQFWTTDGIESSTLDTDIMGATQFRIDPTYGTANVTFSPSNYYFQGNGVSLQAQNFEYGRVLQDPSGLEDSVSSLICSIKPYGTLPNYGKFSCYNSQNRSMTAFQIRPGYEDPFEPYNNIYFGVGQVGPGFYVLDFEAVPVCGSFGSLPF